MTHLVNRFHTRVASRTRAILGLSITVLLLASCSSGPPRVSAPDISPSAAGAAAIDQYDTNGDGIVSGEELAKAPGLQAALERLDTNGDGGVSADEIAARIESWHATGIGQTSFNFLITLDGSPLEGATVTFEPEAFLGTEIKAAQGVSGMSGRGTATIAKQDRPDPTFPPGMHFGLYRVKVSKIVDGRETIPPKYNAETTLGQEVAFDAPEVASNRALYAIKSD